jgi:hypothetical protein
MRFYARDCRVGALSRDTSRLHIDELGALVLILEQTVESSSCRDAHALLHQTHEREISGCLEF